MPRVPRQGATRDAHRIVCLVPSLTETLVDFGLIDRLVGRTRYCVEPKGTIERVETVGGTKNPNVERIVALAPDLVVVNKEENRLEDWQALVAAGLTVFVTHPRSVAESVEMIEELGRLAGAAAAAERLARESREALVRAAEQRLRRETRATAGADRVAVRAFCPIWRNPWMTFRRQTYIGDMLEVVGLENIFGDGPNNGPRAMHGRRQSDGGNRKQASHAHQRTVDAQSRDSGGDFAPSPDVAADFFEIDIDEALAREPEIIVLPDEPYVFGRKHGEELRARGAKAQIFYVDGKDLCWYGPRVPGAVARLTKITSNISRI